MSCWGLRLAWSAVIQQSITENQTWVGIDLVTILNDNSNWNQPVLVLWLLITMKDFTPIQSPLESPFNYTLTSDFDIGLGLIVTKWNINQDFQCHATLENKQIFLHCMIMAVMKTWPATETEESFSLKFCISMTSSPGVRRQFDNIIQSCIFTKFN